MDCWENAQDKYNCLTNEEWGNIQRNVVLKEIETAQNQSDFLGEAYIGSCSVLREFKKSYVEDKFGNTPCAFNEILENLDLKKSCETRVKAKIDFLTNYASGR